MDLAERPRVAILGSGTGSNARALVEYSLGASACYRVDLVIASRSDAGIINVARDFGISYAVLPKEAWQSRLEHVVEEGNVDILALAGFLRKLPTSIIQRLSGRVVNIHPSLLPKFGGAGMYGLHVHRAVLAAHEKVTGATVHLVTDEYDQGAILGQDTTDVLPEEAPESLQERVKRLEHRLYPRVLDEFARAVVSRQ